MNTNISATDVEEIYKKIEKSKKGSFFIDNSDKNDSDITPNHVDIPVAEFYTKSMEHGFDKECLKTDGQTAKKMIVGLY